MSLVELLEELRRLDVRLRAEAGKLQVDAPRGALTPALRDHITALKPELLRFLSQESTAGDGGPLEPTRVVRDGRAYPASFSQQRLWFLSQFVPGSVAHNIVAGWLLEGPLDVEALREALAALIERHEALRTCLSFADGAVKQRIAAPEDPPLRVIPMGDRGDEGWPSALRRLGKEEAQRPFVLGRAPLLRALVVGLGADRHALILTIHHVVVDDWSLGILFRELAVLYGAAREGGVAQLPELPLQFLDFSEWQRARLAGAALQESLSYWRAQFTPLPAPLALPTDRPRPPVQTERGERVDFRWSEDLTERLDGFARQHNVTLFMLVLAGFKALLSRYSAQSDIVVGTPIASRSRKEFESAVGFFVDTLALRTRFSRDQSFLDLLAAVRAAALGAYAHPELPFERLIEEVRPERDPSRPPLFQVMLAFQSAPSAPAAWPDLLVSRIEIDPGTATLDLSLFVRETGGRLGGFAQYNADLFDRGTVERMLAHYQALLRSALEDPGRAVARLKVLGEAERSQILFGWNQTGRDWRNDAAEHTTAGGDTGRTAVVGADGSVSFGELGSRASVLAGQLRGRGLGPGTRVGIYLGRGTDMVVSVLGVLASGAAYVPLDPYYPRERLAFMVRDSALSLVLTEAGRRAELQGLGVAYLAVDELAPLPGSPEGAPIPLGRGATGLAFAEPAWEEAPAYVIYTSGSTGAPKGVLVPRRAVKNLLGSMMERPGLGPGDVLVAVTTLSFDIAVLELLLPLSVGAKVVVASREEATDGARLKTLLESSGATAMQATPATWRLLLGAGWPGRKGFKALCGGEALPVDLAEALLARADEVWNLYGPTETTVWSTCHRVKAPVGTVRIGRPIGNTRVYVLDEWLEPVPVGVAGELHIGGAGLALGYLNQPALTAERFVPDPFAPEPGARMYRTGDLARLTAEGELEHLGRNDDQVKLRGFRIGCGEVEAALRGHPAIDQAVCMVAEPRPGDSRLVAYCVRGGGTPATEVDLRNHLRERLPEYMVPQHWVFVETLPLTANGKVDRGRLPGLDLSELSRDRVVREPASDVERAVASIWKELLGQECVGLEDNFYDLGGHSLLSMALIERIERATNVRIRPRDVAFQTLGQIAATCAAQLSATPPEGPGSGMLGALKRLVGGR